MLPGMLHCLDCLPYRPSTAACDCRMSLVPQVLGVDRHATPEQIKSAYRKLALRLHPDKNQGENAAAAAEQFAMVATAHGILSDPEKRRKYDRWAITDTTTWPNTRLACPGSIACIWASSSLPAIITDRPAGTACSGGYEALQPSDLEVEVDLSSLGVVNTAMAAMFSKLGQCAGHRHIHPYAFCSFESA